MVVIYVLASIIFWLVPICLIMMTQEDEFQQPTDRVIWFIIVFFLPPVGALIYYLRLLFFSPWHVSDKASIMGSFSKDPYQSQDLKRADD